MACLKCGRSTKAVFCDECMQSFEKYPVKPGTPISIPNREAYFSQKKASQPKRRATAEEKNVHLRKLLKILLFLWLITAVALVVFILLWIFF